MSEFEIIGAAGFLSSVLRLVRDSIKRHIEAAAKGEVQLCVPDDMDDLFDRLGSVKERVYTVKNATIKLISLNSGLS